MKIFVLYLTPVFIHVCSFQTCYADLVRKVISSAILIRLWGKNKYVRITLSFFTTSSAEEEGRLFSSLLPIAFKTSGSIILCILSFSESGGMMVSLVKPSRSSLRERLDTALYFGSRLLCLCVEISVMESHFLESILSKRRY